MRAHAASLPLDILDMILACSPDYATLASAVAVCKTFNRAFEGRAAGILRDIATHLYNGREELVREAIRTIFVKNDVFNLNRWAESDQARFTSVFAAQFDDQAFWQRPLTRNLAKELCKRIDDACALEVVFSLRHKDQCTRTTSRLSDRESLNFHYALHRLEVVLSLCRRRHASEFGWGGAERYELYYRRFSVEALFHIYELYSFLEKCVVEAGRHKWLPLHPSLHGYDLRRNIARDEVATITIGTTRIMSVIRDPRTFKFKMNTHRAMTLCKDDLMRHLWPDRRLRGTIPEGARSIVSRTKELTIRCQKCGRRNGGALWNHTNWHELPAYFRLEQLCGFLPRRTARNKYERAQLMAFLQISDNSSEPERGPERVQDSAMTFEEILTALFKMSHPASPAVPLETWMCARCIDDLVASRFWRWWACTKGEMLMDCRYGFDCESQLQRPGHAVMYNHTCPNIHTAHKALETAVHAALAAGRSCRSAEDDLSGAFLRDFFWRARFDVENVRKMSKEDVKEKYGQQLRWAVQAYQETFRTKNAKQTKP